MTHRSQLNLPWSQVVLSLFPGIDLLGRGFEAEGFCVVRGPDLIYGGDTRRFHAPARRFDGIVAGSPCQDFSRARRVAPSGDGLAMLAEFRRIVTEAEPLWWLLENVPAAPPVEIPGYSHQRLDIDARDVGSAQRRLRHFQFGHAAGLVLALPRLVGRGAAGAAPCLASEVNKPGRRDFAAFCALQGLPADFDLPGMTLSAKYRAVGNGVHVEVARMIARAIAAPSSPLRVRLCGCGCGRPVTGKARSAGPACRKRIERKRDPAGIAQPVPVTIAQPVPVTLDVTDQAAGDRLSSRLL